MGHKVLKMSIFREITSSVAKYSKILKVKDKKPIRL